MMRQAVAGVVLGVVMGLAGWSMVNAASPQGNPRSISQQEGQANSVHVQFEDGSIAAIVYTASGDRAFSRERMEIFSQGKVGVLEDFRRMSFVAQGNTKVERWRNQDLGYFGELDAFFSAVRKNEGPPIPIEHTVSSSLATFRILESLATGRSLVMGQPRYR